MMNKLEVQVTMNLDTGEVEVKGPLHLKPLVANALARAITAVIEHKEPVLIPTGKMAKPKQNGLIGN